MKIKVDDLIQKFVSNWDHLKHGGIALPDTEYWSPTQHDVKKYLSKSHLERLEWTKEIFDCDDFALLFHAYIVRQRYNLLKESKLSKKEMLPWSIGQAWLTKVRGKNWNHAINIVYTSDRGIMFIEPQTDEMWKADVRKDNVVFIRM